MVWKVEVQTQAENDLALIFDHLFETYQGFGDSRLDAFDRASERVYQIGDSVLQLGNAPHRGTLREEFGPGVRNITINRAEMWFKLDAEQEIVKVLAFFFGAENHKLHMLKRLLDLPD